MDIALASHPAALGSIPGIPEFFPEKKIADVAEVNPWRCFLEQWTAEA